MKRQVLRTFTVGGLFALIAEVVCGAYRLLGCTEADAVSFMMMTLGIAGAFAAGSYWYRAVEDAGGLGAALPISGLASLVADRVAERVAEREEGVSLERTAYATFSGTGSVLINFVPGIALAAVLALVV